MHIDTVFVQEVVVKEVQREVVFFALVRFPREMIYEVEDLKGGDCVASGVVGHGSS